MIASDAILLMFPEFLAPNRPPRFNNHCLYRNGRFKEELSFLLELVMISESLSGC